MQLTVSFHEGIDYAAANSTSRGSTISLWFAEWYRRRSVSDLSYPKTKRSSSCSSSVTEQLSSTRRGWLCRGLKWEPLLSTPSRLFFFCSRAIMQWMLSSTLSAWNCLELLQPMVYVFQIVDRFCQRIHWNEKTLSPSVMIDCCQVRKGEERERDSCVMSSCHSLSRLAAIFRNLDTLIKRVKTKTQQNKKLHQPINKCFKFSLQCIIRCQTWVRSEVKMQKHFWNVPAWRELFLQQRDSLPRKQDSKFGKTNET